MMMGRMMVMVMIMMMVAIMMLVMMTWGWPCDLVLYWEAGPYKGGNASNLLPISRDFMMVI